MEKTKNSEAKKRLVHAAFTLSKSRTPLGRGLSSFGAMLEPDAMEMEF